jgi:hypothetical protein
MRVLKIELRNYCVEIAIHDLPVPKKAQYQRDIHDAMHKQIKGWMDPNRSTPWYVCGNVGYIHGILFDSDLEVVVRNERDEVIDSFKGADCFEQTFTKYIYSAQPFKLHRGYNTGGRVTGMEVRKEGVANCLIKLPAYAPPYSRDSLHLLLTKVSNIESFDENSSYYRRAHAFVIDTGVLSYKGSEFNKYLIPYETDLQTTEQKQQHLFAGAWLYAKPKTYTEANPKDCDSLRKLYISKKEFV